MHYAMFCWKWLSGSGEIFTVFSLFLDNLPLEKGVPFIWIKLNSLFPEDAWWQIWLNLVLWFLRRKFFNFVNVFYLLEGKDGTSYKLIWIPFTKGCFVPSLVEIVPLVLEKKMKMWKVYDNNDDNNDDKLTSAFGGYPSSGR